MWFSCCRADLAAPGNGAWINSSNNYIIVDMMLDIMSSMRVPVNGCFHDNVLDPPRWWSELLPLGRWLLAHDLGPLGCREEPGVWLCTEWGHAHQLCPPLTALFTLAQLQKAADPWVLKHSDLEKQDNSWKEVSGIAGCPCSPSSRLYQKVPHLWRTWQRGC